MDGRFALPASTIVGGAYRIERVVGAGGFGITYLAEDIKLGTTVALKEYYPFDFGDRDRTMSVRPKSDRHKKTFEWGRANFLQEARTLARFEHSSIVRVTRVFEANSTAYMVMRFEEGNSFEAWLNSLGRPPTQVELDRITTSLLEALQMMHAKNFLHRDIAPDNIIVRADGSPVLLDFGAARQAVAEMSRSLTGIVKAGYSPHEQYSSDGRRQGPWSDIYALGGTLYRAVSGRIPEEATLRVDVDNMPPASQSANGTYRPTFLAAIDACLRVRSTQRPQSIAQLRPMLLGQSLPPPIGNEAEPPLGKGSTRPIARDRPQSSRWLAIAAALAVVLGGAYGGYEYSRRQPAASATRDAETEQLAALIEVRRKEAADAAQRQVEHEEQRRKEAAEAERRQAGIEAERRRQEAAEAARRQAELEVERQRKEALEAAARRQAELEAERQRQQAAEATRRQAELADERRRKEEAEKAAAAAEEATRKAAADAEVKRIDEERRRIASRAEAKPGDQSDRSKAEVDVKSDADREAITRSLQRALTHVGCYRGEIDGHWSIQARAALAQFAKLTKHQLAVDEPSLAALEKVVARTERVCPLECDTGKVESNGKCVGYGEPKVPVPKAQPKPKTGTANRVERPDAREYSRNYWPRRSLIIGGPPVTANTPYGLLTCRSYAPASRVCSWR